MSSVLYTSSYNSKNTLVAGPGSAAKGAGASLTIQFQLGTESSPSATVNGDELGFVQAYGWDGASFSQAIPNAWVFVATENWTSTAHGCITAIQSTPNGTTAGQDELHIGHGVVASTTAPGIRSQGLGQGTLWGMAGVYSGPPNLLAQFVTESVSVTNGGTTTIHTFPASAPPIYVQVFSGTNSANNAKADCFYDGTTLTISNLVTNGSSVTLVASGAHLQIQNTTGANGYFTFKFS